MNRALLVGINEYPGAPLRGCVNDVVGMADLLVGRFGFAHADIRLLVDRRATTRAILSRLGWLLVGAQAGDRLLFYYSGHGAQVATRNPQGEVDGLDEVICPVDFDWSDRHLIRDKQFHKMFANVPAGIEFVWVSDSCHSGDLTRELPGNPAAGDRRIKALVPPADMAWRIRTAKTETPVRPLSITRAADTVHVGLVAGCKSDQTSADAFFEGKANGALSYFLQEELKRGASERPLTDVVVAVTQQLKTAGFDQTPQLEGASEIEQAPFLGRQAGAPVRKAG
jgi:metacaspase-1